MTNEQPAAPHWRFFRAGDSNQVFLERGVEVMALEQLDKKLWAALSCPVHGLEFDARTLALIDSDDDDRIRVPEILAAVRFATRYLKDADLLAEGHPELPLASIDESHDEGRRLLASARRILKTVGGGERSALTVEDVTQAQGALAKLPFNGDGIVPPAAAGDEGVRRTMETVLRYVGGELDRSGELGVSSDRLTLFFDEAAARLAWLKRAREQAETILPLGEATAQADAALQAVREKIDDFFVRCRLAAYDARAALPLSRAETDYAALAARRLSGGDEELAAFPLATVEAGRSLPLGRGVNPAWSAQIAQLRTALVVPLLGERDTLSEEEWGQLQARLAPYQRWQAEQCGAALAELDGARLQELLSSGVQARIAALIEQDLALKAEVEAFVTVERLVRYVRDLAVLLRNFVSFADFYRGERKAIFQAGTLYIDQRSCDLCLRVDDIGRHATVAPLSHTYLLYCDCRRRGGGETMTIAAAVTAGEVDGLRAGRNGVFYDRQGRDWDATVVKVIETPISIRQAFFEPYRRLARFIGAQLEKMAGARSKAVDESMAAGVEGAARTAEGGKAPAAPFDVAKFAGIFAAIGLALGAIGTAIAALVTGLLALAWWQIPLAIAGVILVISGPSMVIAWLKLRRRNLAPLLDGNGWAVNTRARITIPFGTSLTALATLPPGAERPLADPFAEKRRPWGLYLLITLILLAALAYGLRRLA